MKKRLLFSILLLTGIVSYTQYQQPGDSSKTSTAVTEPKERDNRLVAQSIISRYVSVMAFTESQKQHFCTIISGYINEKMQLLPLLSENRMKYEEKQASYFKTLKAKLTGILKKNQWQRFLALKPKPHEYDSALYYIYY
jgi:hypothetical protein